MKNALSRLFIDNIPDELKGINIDLSDIIAIVQKQNAKSAKDINYALLLEDLLFIIKRSSVNIPEPLTSDSLLAHQYINRIGFKSTYYKVMQDNNIHVGHKFEIAYFYRNLLQTVTSIYGIDILHGQQGFIEELKADEEKYEALTDSFNELMKAILSDSDTPKIEVNEYWNHSYDQLCKLSELLHKAGFIDSAATFLQSFCNNPQVICNWQRQITSLMFLVQRIFSETESYKLLDICNFVSNRFTVKGKPKTARMLRETLRNIESKTSDDPKYLGGDYAKLHQIYNAIFS